MPDFHLMEEEAFTDGSISDEFPSNSLFADEIILVEEDEGEET